VGIRDIARVAGLSITTVSHALNGKGEVSAETRQRVVQVADELGYRPNAMARALSSGRSHLLGIAVRHRGSSVWERTYRAHYGALIAGAGIEALEHGYSVVVVPVGDDGVTTSVPLDGLIAVDPVEGDDVLAWAHREAIPTVTDGRPLDAGHDEVLVVDIDISTGMAELLDRVGQGCERVGLLTGSSVDSYTVDTERCFESWCRRRRIAAISRRVAVTESPFDAARALLDREDAPQAVYGLNETYGNALIAAATDLGIRIGQDLRVAMMGSPEAAASEPRAAYLNLNAERTGGALARLLIDRLEGRPAADVVLPCEVIDPREAPAA
jgi:DNA-binding LacI/PurR family transcriptional regulator